MAVVTAVPRRAAPGPPAHVHAARRAARARSQRTCTQPQLGRAAGPAPGALTSVGMYAYVQAFVGSREAIGPDGGRVVLPARAIWVALPVDLGTAGLGGPPAQIVVAPPDGGVWPALQLDFGDGRLVPEPAPTPPAAPAAAAPAPGAPAWAASPWVQWRPALPAPSGPTGGPAAPAAQPGGLAWQPPPPPGPPPGAAASAAAAPAGGRAASSAAGAPASAWDLPAQQPAGVPLTAWGAAAADVAVQAAQAGVRPKGLPAGIAEPVPWKALPAVGAGPAPGPPPGPGAAAAPGAPRPLVVKVVPETAPGGWQPQPPQSRGAIPVKTPPADAWGPGGPPCWPAASSGAGPEAAIPLPDRVSPAAALRTRTLPSPDPPARARDFSPAGVGTRRGRSPAAAPVEVRIDTPSPAPAGRAPAVHVGARLSERRDVVTVGVALDPGTAADLGANPSDVAAAHVRHSGGLLLALDLPVPRIMEVLEGTGLLSTSRRASAGPFFPDESAGERGYVGGPDVAVPLAELALRRRTEAPGERLAAAGFAEDDLQLVPVRAAGGEQLVPVAPRQPLVDDAADNPDGGAWHGVFRGAVEDFGDEAVRRDVVHLIEAFRLDDRARGRLLAADPAVQAFVVAGIHGRERVRNPSAAVMKLIGDGEAVVGRPGVETPAADHYLRSVMTLLPGYGDVDASAQQAVRAWSLRSPLFVPELWLTALPSRPRHPSAALVSAGHRAWDRVARQIQADIDEQRDIAAALAAARSEAASAAAELHAARAADAAP